MAAYDLNAPFMKDEGEGSAESGKSIEERFPSIFNRAPAGEHGAPSVQPPAAGAGNAPAATPVSAARTEYQPATGRRTDEELANQGWGQYLGEAAQNLPGSTMHMVKGMASALSDPGALVTGLGRLGTGAISKAAGALGVEQNQQEKAQKEADLDALVNSYKDQYGDWNKIRRTVHDNPAQPLMDVASVAPVIGPAGRMLGLGEKAAIAARAGSMLDPVQAGLTAATKVVGKPVDYIAKGILSKTSSVPKSMLDVSENVGRGAYATADEAKAARAAFNSGATAENIADTFEKSFGEIADSAQEQYRQKHGILPTNPIPTMPVQQKLDEILNQLGGPSMAPTLFPDEYSVLQRMQQTLASKPSWNAVELDLLKKSFDNEVGALSRAGSKFRGAFAEAPRSIIDSIGTVHPEYAEMLKGWQDWMEKARNLQQNFGKVGKAADAQIMNKLLKGMKTPNGRNLINELRNTPSGKYLPEMLSGYATREWLPGWGTGIGDAAVAGLLYGSGAVVSPHMLVGALAASPKVVGAGMRGLGRLKGAADTAGTVVNPTTRNLISRMNEAGLPVPAPIEGSEQAAGGRIGRKTGGRVGNPASEADRLIAAAEKAKKNQGAKTEALLQVPDEAITKALAVANENI